MPGFDMCTIGIPQLFWDFAYDQNQKEGKSEVYPHFKNLNQFTNKSFEILTDETVAHKLSELQFSDVLQNRDIEKHIQKLENLFCDKAGIKADKSMSTETLYQIAEEV